MIIDHDFTPRRSPLRPAGIIIPFPPPRARATVIPLDNLPPVKHPLRRFVESLSEAERVLLRTITGDRRE